MRVLVEDDARILAADVCKALRAVGSVVETVTDGDEAWFRGDTEDYDASMCLISDCRTWTV